MLIFAIRLASPTHTRVLTITRAGTPSDETCVCTHHTHHTHHTNDTHHAHHAYHTHHTHHTHHTYALIRAMIVRGPISFYSCWHPACIHTYSNGGNVGEIWVPTEFNVRTFGDAGIDHAIVRVLHIPANISFRTARMCGGGVWVVFDVGPEHECVQC